MPRARRRELLSKRVIGYVNWHRGRKYVHRREILDLITRDIVEQKPDHIAVTGDLVNLGLPEEFVRAAEWLHHLGPPSQVTAIPGNHDAYVRLHPERGTGRWQPYMEANAAGETLFPTPPELLSFRAPFRRRRADRAVLGHSDHAVHCRRQTRPAQRKLLATALDRLKQANLFRVVLIHHPPLREQAGWHRGLRDAGRFTRMLKQHGAELVLHGHNHEQTVHELRDRDRARLRRRRAVGLRSRGGTHPRRALQ